jgi:protein SOK2
MINGTKLLNVAGMTRGRRDGILKSEKVRHVVKIGPMHLKGVWYVSPCGWICRPIAGCLTDDGSGFLTTVH